MLTTYYLLFDLITLAHDADTLYWLVHTHTFQCVIFYWSLLPIGVDRRDSRRNILIIDMVLSSTFNFTSYLPAWVIFQLFFSLSLFTRTALVASVASLTVDIRIIASKLVHYYLQLTFLQVSSGSLNHWVGSILSQYDRLS